MGPRLGFTGYNLSMSLREKLAPLIKGDVVDDTASIKKYSRDTSIFERAPKVVVFPKNAADVSAVVKFVHEAKARGEDVSIAARSAGTDMTGGPLTDSIALVFTKYMNGIGPIKGEEATAEPGAYYRDFEALTLRMVDKLVPSYPASREYCAIGGMVANNSGGELTLRYGKTERYVHAVDVILSDGSKVTFKPLTPTELAIKESEDNFEAQIYRNIHDLIQNHESEIEVAKPRVSKNSAGYALWNVIDHKSSTFDLSQLIVGSQGTLGIITSVTLGLVKPKEHRAMLVVFLSDLEILPDIVHRVRAFDPESFESYDDQTFKLAVRLFPHIVHQLGFLAMIRLAISFIPEAWMVMTGGVPKLILMAEFAEDSPHEALERAVQARDALHGLALRAKIAKTEAAAAKYWKIRRESFALLRKNLHGLYAAPFIDDIVVAPESYPQFIPALNRILLEHHLIYTIAGHIGDGNFHIIPLMNLSREKDRAEILELQQKVYKLVKKYGGSITGEHNDGIVRTPYLEMMFGAEMTDLFAEVKRIFDPLEILNPGKKVGGTIHDIEQSMIKMH